MAKPPKPSRKAYIATQTIHRGTPKAPETIKPGEEVDGLSEKEAKDMLDRGMIRAETVRGAAAAEGEEAPPPAGDQQ